MVSSHCSEKKCSLTPEIFSHVTHAALLRGVSVQFKRFAQKYRMLKILPGKWGKMKRDPKQKLKNVSDYILEESPR